MLVHIYVVRKSVTLPAGRFTMCGLLDFGFWLKAVSLATVSTEVSGKVQSIVVTVAQVEALFEFVNIVCMRIGQQHNV